MTDLPLMRFVCEIDGEEHLIDADSPEVAACRVAEAHGGQTAWGGRVVVNVAEANEADVPLIAGTDYTVALDADGARVEE